MPTLQNAYAEGTISVSRVVVAGTTHRNSAKQAVGATVPALGIAQNSGRLRPDPSFSQSNVDQAAIVGENVGIYGPGSVGVDGYCNFAWTAGDLLMPDAAGKLIVATAGSYFIARAQGPGTVDALCAVDVLSPAKA